MLSRSKSQPRIFGISYFDGMFKHLAPLVRKKKLRYEYIPVPLKSHDIQITTRDMYNYFFPKKKMYNFCLFKSQKEIK